MLSNASGTLAEVLEYYPFGGTRLDDRTAAFSEQRRFTGHEFDAGTGLNYMDARYQAPTLSRFLNEDPNFITAGAPDWVTGVKGDPTYAALNGFVNTSNINYLENPQNLSPYSYVDNNPLRYVDPDGRWYVSLYGSVSYTPFNFNAGLSFDQRGVYWFGSSGTSVGLEESAGASLFPLATYPLDLTQKYLETSAVRLEAGLRLPKKASSILVTRSVSAQIVQQHIAPRSVLVPLPLKTTR